mgnify:CR=1 FL=1
MPRAVWFALAAWGAVHPMAYFLGYMRATGSGLPGTIEAWFANASTTGLTWDLVISAIVLTLWVVVESRQRRNWRGLIAIPATFCIGVSCGLPLYLALRQSRDTDT